MRNGIVAGLIVIGALGGCSSWDNLSSQEKGTAVGAGVGGVAGAALSNGSVLGTVGGAAVGGVVGNQIGKHRDD